MTKVSLHSMARLIRKTLMLALSLLRDYLPLFVGLKRKDHGLYSWKVIMKKDSVDYLIFNQSSMERYHSRISTLRKNTTTSFVTRVTRPVRLLSMGLPTLTTWSLAYLVGVFLGSILVIHFSPNILV